MPITSSDLRNKALTGSIAASDIDELLSQQVKEDQYLDYKHGNILAQNRPCELVREYLTGFANASGGVLLIGIEETNERPATVTGARAPGGHALDRWAKDCVLDLAGYFSPPPRFQIVNHTDGDILVAAAARSVNLVPDVRGREILYHLRIGDSTVQVPEYLLADLVLGRRQHPVLRISDYYFAEVGKRDTEPDHLLSVKFGFQIENDSLAWAEDMRMGLVAYSQIDSAPRPVSKQLTINLDIESLDESHFTCQTGLVHLEMGLLPAVLGPFTVAHLQMQPAKSFSIPLRRYSQTFTPYTWRGAGYLVSKNSPPYWYQLKMTIDAEFLDAGKDGLNKRKEEFLEVSPMVTERPVVAWRPLS